MTAAATSLPTLPPTQRRALAFSPNLKSFIHGDNVRAGQQSGNVEDTDTLGDEARGDLGIYGFWNKRRQTILDFCITNTDARAYDGYTDSKKVLERAARQKKQKYEEACRERRRDFTPMCYSVDGLASKETRAAEQRLAGLLAAKWERPYSEMACYVRTRMSLALVRSNTLLLRGGRSKTWRQRGPATGVAASVANRCQRW